MVKTSILKLFIILCIFAIYAIPEFGKELFVAKTGKFDHPGPLAAVLLSVGLLLNWKHIHYVINIVCILMLGATFFLYIFYFPNLMEKPCISIYAIVLIVTIILNLSLVKLERKREKEALTA